MREENENFDRSPPIAVFLSGESFFRSAQYLRKAYEKNELRLRFDMPVYYLYGHALELTLKGFLRSKGFTDSQVHRFRHSLESLWVSSLKEGLSIYPVKAAYIEEVIALLDRPTLEHEFRYIKVGMKNRPTLESVEQAVIDLIAVVRPHCVATVSQPIPDRG